MAHSHLLPSVALDPHAGHAGHFLSRLDRVSREHVELALSLYNDTPLLQSVLRRAGVPEASERVAISLGSIERGPFLIVTRDARFVTCLGEGMRTCLPVVPRDTLDTVAERLSTFRHRKRISDVVLGRERPIERIIDRLLHAGPSITREEITGMMAWVPVLRPALLQTVWKLLVDLEFRMGRLLAMPKVDARSTPLLRSVWNDTWAACHMATLLAGEGEETVKILAAVEAETSTELVIAYRSLSALLARTQMVGAALRGAYLAVRGGAEVPAWALSWSRQATTYLLDATPADRAHHESVRTWGDELPAELALAAAFSTDAHVIDRLATFAACPLESLHQTKVEDLYFPKSAMPKEALRFSYDRALAWIERCRARHVRPTPYVAPGVPGRNEPCHCGSGRKLKKCCLH